MSVTPPDSNWTLVPVTGTWRQLDGTPCKGTISFVVSTRVVDTTDRIVFPAGGKFSATLDMTGSISLSLPAVDDPDNSPANWSIQVTEQLTTGGGLSYFIQPSLGMLPDGLDLTSVVIGGGATPNPAVLRGVPGGLAALNADGNVVNADGSVAGGSVAITSPDASITVGGSESAPTLEISRPAFSASTLTVSSDTTLTPQGASVQTLVLSPTASGNSFVANTVNLTVMPAGPFSLDLDVRQDLQGGRLAVFHNVVWDENRHPSLNQASGASTFVHLWSPDGSNVYGRASSAPFPGVDPITVPGIAALYEAWPLAETTTGLDPLPARSGPAMGLSGSTPAPPNITSKVGVNAGVPLKQFEQFGRRAFDYTVVGSGDVTANVNLIPANGFTIVCAYFIAAEPTAPDSNVVWAISEAAQTAATSWWLQFLGPSNTPNNVMGLQFSSTSFEQAGTPPGGKAMCDIIIVKPGNQVITWRQNGVDVSAGASGNSATGWSFLATQSTVFNTFKLGARIDNNAAEAMNGYISHASVFPFALPFDHPDDIGFHVERWAAATMGLVL